MDFKFLVSGKWNSQNVRLCSPTEICLYYCKKCNGFYCVNKRNNLICENSTGKDHNIENVTIDHIGLGWSTHVYISGQQITFDNGKASRSSKLHSSHINGVVTSISCNWKQTILSVRNGFNLIWSDEDLTLPPRKVKVSGVKDKLDEHVNLKYVSAGEMHNLAITDENMIGSIKEEYNNVIFQPLNVQFKIKMVACGKEHALLLSVIGTLLSMGLSSRGQLGHGGTEKQPQPKCIEALDGVSMVSIAAGGWHSGGVSDIGDLYTWGWNESGQLGMPCHNIHKRTKDKVAKDPINILTVPGFVEIKSDEMEQNIVKVACGSRHTVALTEHGSVYSWGWNEYGQLGLSDTKSIDEPRKVCFPKESDIVTDIICNYWTTVFKVKCKS